MEKSFPRYLQRVYSEISSLGLSAGLSRLSTLGKFQHSVNYQEALLALDFLFRLCDQFQCTDIPELFKLFFIYEYWNRQKHAIFLPPKTTPHFEIIGNSVVCSSAEFPKKGCLDCSHFDTCEFPRNVTADDLFEVNWRCIICGNPLEFPTVLFQSWLSYTHHVKTQFLCCICFLEYSNTEEELDILSGTELPYFSPDDVLPSYFEVSMNENMTNNINLTDLLNIILGVLCLLSSQLNDSRYVLHYNLSYPLSKDIIAQEAIKIAGSQVTQSKFTYLQNIFSPTLTSPRLDALFDYCLGFLDPQDIISLEDTKAIVFAFSEKFKDFLYALMKSHYVPHILSILRENSTTWDDLNSWIANQFKANT
ncbi:MAG: hypothetical protein RBG13Loki_2830 [Promethearchaeota archaeon CR_4]|nr:MAG: hypothetical protein RBG13Loki_2830 [Candidatus Lokiarchaeota archaeon CR_4]